MHLAKRLESVGEYYFSQKLREIDNMRREGKAVINLGIGSPDMPPHPSVIQTLQSEAAKPHVHAYQSYKGSPVLRNAISNWYQTHYQVTLDPETEILPLIGSKEGIMHICMTYLNEGDKALIPNPGYPTYRSAITLAGGIPVDYELKENNQWYPDLVELEKQDLSGVKLMWVSYPHMPTGTKASREVFTELVAFAKKYGILLCHDNPYSFILNDEPMSLLSIPGAKEVAVELNSLSKSHNMAGWRVGMLSGSRQRIDEVLRFKSNMDSGMFLPVQLAAAQALLLPAEWYDQVNQEYSLRRQHVFSMLDTLGCIYDREQVGMFVWARIPAGYKDGYQLSDEVLHRDHVFITPGGIFGTEGNGYIRVSLCSSTSVFEESHQRILKSKLINA